MTTTQSMSNIFNTLKAEPRFTVTIKELKALQDPDVKRFMEYLLCAAKEDLEYIEELRVIAEKKGVCVLIDKEI